MTVSYHAKQGNKSLLDFTKETSIDVSKSIKEDEPVMRIDNEAYHRGKLTCPKCGSENVFSITAEEKQCQKRVCEHKFKIKVKP